MQKQIDELKAEVKELSEANAPLVDEKAGIPAGNGTGEAPKTKQISRVSRDSMTYENVRKAMKKE